jgi:hypothetical protein
VGFNKKKASSLLLISQALDPVTIDVGLEVSGTHFWAIVGSRPTSSIYPQPPPNAWILLHSKYLYTTPFWTTGFRDWNAGGYYFILEDCLRRLESWWVLLQM